MDPKLQEEFKKLQEDLKSSETGPVRFLKKGQNSIRLVLPEGRSPLNFFANTTSYFGTKASPKYLVFALVKQRGETITPAEEVMQVHPVLIGKQVRDDVLNQLANGWDLFDLENGHPIVITKSGEGFGTSYSVSPGPKPLSLKKEEIIWPEKTLEVYAKEYAEYSASKGTTPKSASKDEVSLGEEEMADWG